MQSDPSPHLAQLLVNAFAAMDSTEQLIIFVAGTDRMLGFCQELLEQHDRDSHAPLPQEINALCQAQALVPGMLYTELRKVLLALNRFHDAGRDQYAVLGLSADASREEVKSAFRSLSKRYHPDRAGGSGGQTQRFMEIAGAYHSIMAALPQRQQEEQRPWRAQRHIARRSPPRLRLFFLGIAVMVSILAGVSIYLASRYDQEMLISQLQTASSPPKADEELNTASEESRQKTPRQETTAAAAPRVVAQSLAAPAGHDSQPSAFPDDQPPERLAPALPHPGMAEAARKEIATDKETVTPAVVPAQPAPPGPSSKPLPHRTGPQPESPPRTDEKSATPMVPTVSQKSAPTREERKQTLAAGSRPSGEKEILALIDRYSSLYTRKELTAFLALFSEHATENSRPLPDLTDQYRSLFAHTLAIDLKIVNMNLQPEPDGFRAQGSFRSSYTYNDGRTRIHNGDISFLLVDDHGALKIKTLEYVFQE